MAKKKLMISSFQNIENQVPNVASVRKSTRKTTAIVEFAPPSASSILKDETKSVTKRATKSVLFAVVDTPEDMGAKPRRRMVKTPRQSRAAELVEEEEQAPTENSPAVPSFAALDISKVTLSRGRHRSKSTPHVQLAINSSEAEDSPLNALPGNICFIFRKVAQEWKLFLLLKS